MNTQDVNQVYGAEDLASFKAAFAEKLARLTLKFHRTPQGQRTGGRGPHEYIHLSPPFPDYDGHESPSVPEAPALA